MRDMMGNLTNEYIIALKIGCVLVPLQFVDNSKNKEVEIEGDPVAIDWRLHHAYRGINNSLIPEQHFQS